MRESKIRHGGGVKSLLCTVCAPFSRTGSERGGVNNSLISVRVVLLKPLFSREAEEEVAACWLMLCCCASGRWYFLFLDSLRSEGTVNNPASLNASLNSAQALQSEPPGNAGS